MFALIIGGSGSGKSEYGESLILGLGERRRIYVATMKPWDEECEKRIERHRRMRREKNFETVECYRNLKGLRLEDTGRPAAVLLECMSNLVSNELFGLGEEGEAPCLPGSHAVEEILEGIRRMKEQSMDLVLVTNEVFSDGDSYGEETNAYRRVLGEINRKAASMADAVVEVVAGIPVFLKK
ncbi:bifunctional adenosylcobinamide kinase/adenosylcobinamide-phosphate guanylyltransferase [Lachnospiraceae bacterium 54-53]